MLQADLTETSRKRMREITLPPSEIQDADIIQRIKSGDVNAYGSIMRRYNQRMFRIARSIITDDAGAMDVVQEAHIKAYTKLDSFRDASGFYAWLATITRNEALMYLRKHNKEVAMEDDNIQFLKHKDEENKPSIHDDLSNALPDSLLENKELQKLIDQHIDNLSEKFRVVFVLRAIEQFSVKETAKILDIKEETVKTRFFRAKRTLRSQIQTYLDKAGMKVYEFGGNHCDIIVHHVMEFIRHKKL